MKKIISILTIVLFSIVATNCSKDDSNPIIIDSSKLYGTWVLDYYVADGILVEDIDCADKISYSFISDGTYTKTTYAGNDSNNCELAVIVNGTWENLGDDQIELIPNGSTANDVLNISFKDNYSKFTLEYGNRIDVYTKRL